MFERETEWARRDTEIVEVVYRNGMIADLKHTFELIQLQHLA